MDTQQRQSFHNLKIGLCVVLTVLTKLSPLLSQCIGESEKRYVRVGSLQSHFSAYGAERAWNNIYYEGLIWPADYTKQDNAVIKRAWISAKDFTDDEGQYWDTWGTYIAKSYVGNSLYPVELKQTTKFDPPSVFVDGINISAPFAGDIDGDPNANQVADRIITNVVNTSLGLTMTRRILAFSQQYHDNYFIKEFIFKNTGNVDCDDEIELNDSLKNVRIGWGTRYSVCREGSETVDNQQSWGKHTWVTVRGEDYPDHFEEEITEANPIVDWIRCGFSWFGQSELVSFDNIGAPDRDGNGRLTAPQFAGSAVLHVDKSANVKEDDPYQPAVLGWHAGDSYPSVGDITPTDIPNMIRLWDFLAGVPYPSDSHGGTNRMWEDNTTSIIDPVDPYTIHNDGSGTNVWITYGPFDLGPGDSVVIVEVEAISGLSRLKCEEIGRNWKNNAPDLLPDGSTTNNRNEYKNAWVYTGIDSILQSFGRALRNYRLEYNIPQPPLPPPVFDVASGGDKIMLSWSPSPNDGQADFAGYKIYRAIGKPDTVFKLIHTADPGETTFDDVSATRGQSYYYYLVAFNDGSNNTSGAANPIGPLHSSRFYTRTTAPASLKRKAGTALNEIRVVPNPYHISAGRYNMQYVEEPDKIMFLDIPGKCIIRIFTERGDLVEKIVHSDGSGDETWNLISSSRQVVVSGIYLAHFEVTESLPGAGYKKGDTAIRKFVIIR